MSDQTAAGSDHPVAAVSRRRLLDVLLGGSFLAWAGAVVFPVLRYLTPRVDAGGAGKVALTDPQKQELARNGFVVIRLGSDRVLLFKNHEQRLSALSAKCTHEGCTVQFVPSDAMIWCACHNGKFALDGRVISGPPPRPLVAYAVEGKLEGAVSVSRMGVKA